MTNIAFSLWGHPEVNIKALRDPRKARIAKIKARLRQPFNKYAEATYTVHSKTTDGTPFRVVFGEGWHTLYAPGIISHADYFNTWNRAASMIQKRKWWQVWKPRYYPVE